MVHIDESLPEDPLAAEMVLHVRLHLRRQIVQNVENSAQCLRFLFDLEEAEPWLDASERAAQSRKPIATLASEIAHRNQVTIVQFGHAASFLTRCDEWLIKRKSEERAFDSIVAYDRETLLTLSRAIDIACLASPAASVNDSSVPVSLVISGETGTGKELLARSIHVVWERSVGKQLPFVAVQVSGQSVDFINDELFGHVKGGYTGAVGERKGRLMEASGGTLLIDEVGDLPPEAQLRLLRFLQDGNFSHIGSDHVQTSRVRVISATWHDLDQLVKEGKFRLDLLQRLRAERLTLPSLHTRRHTFGRILPPMLARLGHHAVPPISWSAQEALSGYEWPGNLRELESVLRVSTGYAQGSTVRLDHLPFHLQRAYLSCPIQERAVGFLCDELETTELEVSVIQWRIKQLCEKLYNSDVEESDEIAEVVEFLESVPDETVEHASTLDSFRTLGRLEKELRRSQNVLKELRRIRDRDLPDEVRRCLSDEIEIQSKVVKGKETELDLYLEKLTGLSSPWWNLYRDVSQASWLRLFKSDERVAFLIVAMRLLKIAYEFKPDLINQLRELFREYGFRGVLSILAEALPDTRSDGSVQEQEQELPKPKDISVEQWNTIVNQSSSYQEVAKQVGCDVKTVKKYLKQRGVVARWDTSHQGDSGAL